jgi:hypothetical protein
MDRLTRREDYGADEKTVPYLLNEFYHYFETPFDTTDPNFAECTMDRQNTLDTDGTSSMYIVNHFLDEQVPIPDTDILVPNRAAAPNTNAATGTGSIGAQAGLCVGAYGRWPNVVLIDYFGEGNAIAAQNTMNGLNSE